MILQSKRVWIINDWLQAQVEISAQSGRIEGIYPYGTKRVDLDLGNMRVVMCTRTGRMASILMMATRRGFADGFSTLSERE